MADVDMCTQGPCWDGYVYIGPKPRAKGSCKKISQIPKSHICYNSIGKNIRKKSKGTQKPQNNQKGQVSYEECLISAQERQAKGELKLCPRGYCTAKNMFEVYPSAYANGYASQVCQGTKPDYLGVTKSDQKYETRVRKLSATNKNNLNNLNDLQRWYKEAWVNVCEKGDGPGGYAICGSGNGIDDPKNYPYCRAYYRLPGTPVVTAQELTKDEIETMCKRKRSLPQGVHGKPTRVLLPANIRTRVFTNKNQNGGSYSIDIPQNVRDEAQKGLRLINAGFEGGTQTGWDRGNQLAFSDNIDLEDLADMRTWFARHGPDASSGGTSYPGYCNWFSMGEPMRIGEANVGKKDLKGAVSWLIWGGDPAYLWLKTPEIRKLLLETFPSRKEAIPDNLLGC